MADLLFPAAHLAAPPEPTWTRAHALLLLAMALVLSACGNAPAPSTSADTGTPPQDAGALEIIGGDVATHDATAAADAVDDGGATPDTMASVDTTVADTEGDFGSGLPFDVQKPDVPYVDLKVISTAPKAGGMATGADAAKAAFSVTFSNPVNDQSIADYTVQVIGPGNQPVAGLFQVAGPVLSFKADKDVAPASRVDVTVTIQVQDLKGQTLAEAYSFHFHTPGFADQGPYEALARRYAPDIRQGLGATAPANDLLRAIDYDGDWDATNNALNTSAHDAKATVGWAVAETQSHFFVHYVYTWPRRPKGVNQSDFDNDTAGATVVVRRYPSEEPVALETWFKKGSDERRWLWVTQESGLIPAGKKPGQVNVRAVWPVDKLFPKATDSFGCVGACTPRRFPAYLTGGSHQSCLWPDGGETLPDVCATNALAKSTMKLVRYLPGVAATAAEAKGAAPDGQLPTFAYALAPVFDTWFPRRASPSLFQKPITFTYKAPAGRPGGQKTPMGSKLLGGGSDFGRPPWAWRWKPANNSSYYDLPRGTVFMDPAHALWARMGGKNAGMIPFDAQTKAGFSQAYCFAPFLFVDQRTQAPCKGSLPTP